MQTERAERGLGRRPTLSPLPFQVVITQFSVLFVCWLLMFVAVVIVLVVLAVASPYIPQNEGLYK